MANDGDKRLDRAALYGVARSLNLSEFVATQKCVK
jgi:hypothetical protein